jgi:hypothetical protein
MKTAFFLISFIFCFANTFSQTVDYRFGKLRQDELDMKKYQEDPAAEAVVLFDIGHSKFLEKNNSFVIQFTRTRRIKVFNKAGTSFAEVSIPYYMDGYGKSELVRSIDAVSYNYEDNNLQKTALDPAAIQDEIVNDNWKVRKFVLPNVREGTIFEYKYVIETPFHFNLPDWEFQDKIPTVYSQYTVEMIPFYEYVFIAQGISRFSYQNSEVAKGLTRRFGPVEFQDMVNTYVLRDVPAFRDESFMTSREDYIIKMDFQLAKFTNLRGVSTNVISTWDELNKMFLRHENFGKCIKKGQKEAQKILEEELSVEHLNDREKTQAIVEYVKRSFKWNGFNSKYTSKSTKDLLKERTGNAADINLFLNSLLIAAGLNAEPVLISTRSHGKINTNYPFSHYFNYAVVMIDIDGSLLLTDGTESNIGYDKIPPRCLNEKGLVIKDGELEWINLNSNLLSSDVYNIEMTIDPESKVGYTSVVAHSTNFESFYLKEKYENDSVEYSQFLLDNGFSSISKLEFKNYSEPEKKYYRAYEGIFSIEQIADKIIISPFLYIPPKENRLTQEVRTYPVDFIYPKSVKIESKIYIPDGYKMIEQPDKIKIINDDVALVLQYELKDNLVSLNGEYTFKQAVYPPSEYDNIKYYMKYLVKLFNSPIVLQKDDTQLQIAY